VDDREADRVRIVHVTAHLPPDQAANALLPAHLGRWGREAGHAIEYVAHPPIAGTGTSTAGPMAGSVTWIPRGRGGLLRRLKLASLTGAVRISRAATPALARADLVHLHSNGLLPEVCARLAASLGKPTVLTLYGTEIWHYRQRRGIDLFTRMYRRASFVTFYSRGLRDRALELGLGRPHTTVTYPPVAEPFARAADGDERSALRERLDLRAQFILLNVKRLHPLAGQQSLIEALPEVLRAHPDTLLVFCGAGPLRASLEAHASARGVATRVRFTGLVDNARVAEYNRAADLFVLPSRLEALPTVAIEALASGTPVISTDHPGGIELHGLFESDVELVPREQSGALAAAIIRFLDAPRRVHPSTMDVLAREFAAEVVRDRYLDIYRRAMRSRAGR
jgi:glycosyltransferase involved in cell wall biosynthesis